MSKDNATKRAYRKQSWKIDARIKHAIADLLKGMTIYFDEKSTRRIYIRGAGNDDYNGEKGCYDDNY
jgi:hypothetical protein